MLTSKNSFDQFRSVLGSSSDSSQRPVQMSQSTRTGSCKWYEEHPISKKYCGI